ncbi:hypothetical protein ACTQ11_08630 [Collinsella bouchesdurhonensis]|uniref:hypothetical protein n=1 Tax=Collinsella bouchesdurhonensis TaxID=1907654 RepID=UPI003F90DCD4
MSLTYYTATALTPLHHGAGTAGNTALLRTEQIIQPDGTTATVPYISGNSIRHGLRSALAWHLARTLNIEPGSLSKPVVDLLWSGGAITETGSQTNLDTLRRVEELLPHLAMLGYSARSDLAAGTVRISPLMLVCAENAWRLPGHVAETAHALKRAAAYRSEEFGTRHDITTTPAGRYLDMAQTLASTQMIYDWQTIKSGAVLCGSMQLTPAATEQHQTMLAVAASLWAPDGVAGVGAKSSTGAGMVRIDGLGTDPHIVDAWSARLENTRADILDLLTEVAG